MTGHDGAPQAAPSPEEMHQLALRVAVLGVREDDAKQAYAAARAAAGPRFALARKLGLPQQVVVLPGNVEAGKLALKAGATTVDVDEDALLALIAGPMASETEDYIIGEAAADPRTVALLAEHAPDLVELRIKDDALRNERAIKILSAHAPDLVNLRMKAGLRVELQDYLLKHEGCVPDPITGEPVKVATITHHDPTGDFTWTGKTKFMPRVREALESGRLVITATGDVAVTVQGAVEAPSEIPALESPARPTTQMSSDQSSGAPDDSLFFAEDGGFKSPKLAALHAIQVQGGFSTPAREARRMLRDGGPSAGRARAWLAEHGLAEDGDTEPGAEEVPGA